MLQAARRLYVPEGEKKRMDLDESLALTRKLALVRACLGLHPPLTTRPRALQGYDKFKDVPQIQMLVNQVREYDKLLLAFGVRDHQVASINKPPSWIYKRLAWRVFLLFA